jgi:hypothetical protein
VVDVMDDLGIGTSGRSTCAARIQFKRGWKLRGSYTPFNYQGDTEVDSSFTYGDTRYARFERVVTTMKGAYYGGDLEWDFLKGPHGSWARWRGPGLFDVDAALVNASINSQEVDTITTPCP